MNNTVKALALGAMILYGVTAFAAEGRKAGLKAGDSLGNFQVVTISEEKKTFQEIRGKGKAAVFSFFGLRCGACIEEMPSLNRLFAVYRKKGLEVFGVNVDGVDGKFLADYLPKSGVRIDYPILVDPEFALVGLFRMESAPLTVLLDSEGVVRFVHLGYKAGDEAELEKAIVEALGEIVSPGK